MIINDHQWSSIIINHHQSSSIIINHHQSSSMITNHHQWSSRRRRRTGVNCQFFTKLGKLLTSAPDVRLRFFKKGKWSELNFRNFWPGLRHLRPNTNTQIRKDKYTITRITPFWNAFSVQWSVLFSKTIQYKRRQKQHRTTLIFFNKKNKAYI